MAWPDDIARYEGKYKAGYEKQLKMGLIDKRYQLSPPAYEPWK
jgi:arylsulfatase